jgi:hypothetical protein
MRMLHLILPRRIPSRRRLVKSIWNPTPWSCAVMDEPEESARAERGRCFAGDEHKAFRGGFLLHDNKPRTAGRSIAMRDLDLSQREARLKEQTGESFLRRIGDSVLQNLRHIGDISSIAGGRAHPCRFDRDGEADSRIFRFFVRAPRPDC